jgi:predicted acetylornithine/succinylornithine family transaminase
VVTAVKKQAETLMHVSNLYHIETQIRVAELLTDISFADRVFFCNSGAEANEGAIKLARKFGHEKLDGRYELITMEHSFHGRTLATITATGQPKFQKGFEPLPEGFRYVPFNDLSALENAISNKTVGVLVEPIQAEGGVRVPDNGYLRGVRQICSAYNLLMILDEVQVGIGRTGTLFAYEQEDIRPDIMTLAKALGNGFPIGALLATNEAASAFTPGSHASTFGGNPLAMAAAEAVLNTILSEPVLEHCREIGAYFFEALKSQMANRNIVMDIRGRGLLIGVELSVDATDIVRKCREHGVLIATAGSQILRFIPPLTVTKDDVDRVLDVLGKVM